VHFFPPSPAIPNARETTPPAIASHMNPIGPHGSSWPEIARAANDRTAVATHSPAASRSRFGADGFGLVGSGRAGSEMASSLLPPPLLPLAGFLASAGPRGTFSPSGNRSRARSSSPATNRTTRAPDKTATLPPDRPEAPPTRSGSWLIGGS